MTFIPNIDPEGKLIIEYRRAAPRDGKSELDRWLRELINKVAAVATVAGVSKSD